MRLTDAERLEVTARAMIAADKSDEPLEPILRKKCAFVYRQLKADGRHSELWNLWGNSLNFDENRQFIIVHPAILRTVGDVAGRDLVGRVVHAGLTHTYGYLFSLIDTPYGKKRERWMNRQLERGLGIQSACLRARPREGTLLANLSWFLSRIALADAPRRLAILDSFSENVAAEIRNYPYSALAGQRIIEEFDAPDERNRSRHVTILTDLIRLPCPPRSRAEPTFLLVYSVKDCGEAGPQLITAFTVTDEVVASLTAPETLGCDVPIRTRYNCYLAGLTGHAGTGTRRVVAHSL